jgi:hypothetical protein
MGFSSMIGSSKFFKDGQTKKAKFPQSFFFPRKRKNKSIFKQRPTSAP